MNDVRFTLNFRRQGELNCLARYWVELGNPLQNRNWRYGTQRSYITNADWLDDCRTTDQIRAFAEWDSTNPGLTTPNNLDPLELIEARRLTDLSSGKATASAVWSRPMDGTPELRSGDNMELAVSWRSSTNTWIEEASTNVPEWKAFYISHMRDHMAASWIAGATVAASVSAVSLYL